MTDADRPGEWEAVEAAARQDYMEAFCGDPDVLWEDLQEDLRRSLLNFRRSQIAAAYPVIAAAVREQIAGEIEDRRESLVYDYASSGDAYTRGGADGLEAAARIARGTPDGQG